MGGSLGTILRHLIVILPNSSFKVTNILLHPWAIVFINIVASTLLAKFSKLHLNENARLFLMTGFCGSFSSFSTYINDIIKIWKDGHYFKSIIYFIASNLISLLTVSQIY